MIVRSSDRQLEKRQAKQDAHGSIISALTLEQ